MAADAESIVDVAVETLALILTVDVHEGSADRFAS